VSASLLYFPPFRLDPSNERLWRETLEIPLRPKTFAVLRYLVEHAEQLVTKEELLNAVWAETVVGEDALTGCIRELRTVFGEEAKQPRYIETVHRRGFRFIAPVTSAEVPVSSAPALPLPVKPSIIVLPFVNMSHDPDQEYFSDGLTDVLTGDLSLLSGLFVIARNSAFTYKGKAVNMQDIRKELGVRYVLEGSVQRAAEQVRIVAQLVDTTTDAHTWSERTTVPSRTSLPCKMRSCKGL